MILRPCGNGTSTALHFSGGMVHQQHLMASPLRPSGMVHQIFLRSRMILRPSGNGASTAHRGQDLKILCLPAEEVPPLRPSGNDQKILCPQAEEVPLLRPSGMVLRPRGNGTSTALHFPGQAAWISRGGHTSQAKRRHDQKILYQQAEEVPLLRPCGMVLRPSGMVHQLLFTSQARWHDTQAKRQWCINCLQRSGPENPLSASRGGPTSQAKRQ